MGKYSLPGFRFHPTDVELVKYFLKRKVLGKKFTFEAIAEIDIYKHAPWDLPDLSSLHTGDLKWFFFSPIEKKYARGARLNRATVFGYWKTTGKDRAVMYNEEVVGMIKTLVFHQGKAPHGDRTDWVMHEYRLEEKGLADRGVVQDTYVLCVVFKKDGMGHRNGAQYGALFKEEDWSDDDEDTNLVGTGSVSGISTLAFGGASSSHVPERLCADASVNPNATLSVTIDSNAPSPVVTDADAAFTCVDAPQVPAVVDAKAVLALMEDAQLAEVLEIFTEADANNFEAPLVSDDDDIFSMLASFTEDNNLNNVLYPFE